MPRPPEQELGERLADLKQRSGKSYTALAKRTGISRSTLHRYCQGQGVPESYGTVETLARACGADRAELLQLHQLWALATLPTAAEAPAVQPVEDATPEDPTTTTEDDESRPAGTAAVELPETGTAPAQLWQRARRTPRLALLAITLLTVPLVALGATTTARLVTHQQHHTAGPTIVQRLTGPRWSDAPRSVPADFFGVTVNDATGAMPGFGVGAVRLWNSGTRWAELEPQRGSFDWTTSDQLVTAARRAGLPVLFSFGATPSWASPDGTRMPASTDGARTAPPDNLSDWDAYVHAVTAQYGDRISAYQVWNLAPSPQSFTGSAQLLVQLTRRASAIIRAEAPHATVVCPAMGDLWQPAAQKFLLDFAMAGGYQYCNVAAVELHPRGTADPPESVVQLTDLVENTLRQAGVVMAVWNTGTTDDVATPGPPLDQARSADYAVRSYLLGLYARFERMYFDSWDGGRLPTSFQSADGRPTRAGQYVAQLQRWLVGKRITQCGHGLSDGLPASVWECRFLIPSSHDQLEQDVIRWSDSGRTVMPAESGAFSLGRLDGSTSEVRPGQPLEISEQPILIRDRASLWGSGQGN